MALTAFHVDNILIGQGGKKSKIMIMIIDTYTKLNRSELDWYRLKGQGKHLLYGHLKTGNHRRSDHIILSCHSKHRKRKNK